MKNYMIANIPKLFSLLVLLSTSKPIQEMIDGIRPFSIVAVFAYAFLFAFSACHLISDLRNIFLEK